MSTPLLSKTPPEIQYAFGQVVGECCTNDGLREALIKVAAVFRRVDSNARRRAKYRAAKAERPE